MIDVIVQADLEEEALAAVLERVQRSSPQRW
jgi:hypothetical protein